MNEIRTLNSTRYIYTATRNEDGRLIYVVDGLDPSVGDETGLKRRWFLYSRKALSEKQYILRISLIQHGNPILQPTFVTAEDESNEVIGAFCIEI